MRDFPPLYSAILRALADVLAANLPSRIPRQQDDPHELGVASGQSLAPHAGNHRR